MTVWIVFRGNYHPRELLAICSTREAAEMRAAELDPNDAGDIGFEEWTVQS